MSNLKSVKKLMDEHMNYIKHKHHKPVDCYFNIEYDASAELFTFSYFPYLSESNIVITNKDFDLMLDSAYCKLEYLLLNIRTEEELSKNG